MPSELSDLLERGAERPTSEPDFADLARRGRRRRHTQQATTAMAIVAVLALTAGVLIPRLRQPDVVFDSGPRGGVGTWEAVPPSPIGARDHAIGVADDRRVVVMGGTKTLEDGGEEEATDGAVYDLESRTWTWIHSASLPFSLGSTQLELLSDERLLLFSGDEMTAAFYDFAAKEWEVTPEAPLNPRSPESVVWTGKQLIVWGGWTEAGVRADGAVWTPGRGWSVMAPSPLAARSGSATSWTGDRLLVWGGGVGDAEMGEREQVFADGAAYDPATDRWTALAASPLEARQGVHGLWTGSEWIIVGGYGAATPIKGAKEPTVLEQPVTEDCAGATCTVTGGGEVTFEPQSRPGEDFVDGARYDPSTDEWTPIALPPKGFRGLAGFDRSDRIIAYGKRGQSYAQYDVASDTWAERTSPALNERTSAWDAVAVGSHSVLLNTGGPIAMADTDRPRRLGGLVYQERTNRWDALAEADTAQREGAVAMPVGERLFVWGGTSVTRDISQGYSSEDGDPWHHHDDGAVLTLE